MTKHLLDKTQHDEDILSLIREMLVASGARKETSKYRHILNNYGSGPNHADIADCLNQMGVLTRTGKEWDVKNLTKHLSRIPEPTKKKIGETVDYEALERFENPFAAKNDRSQKDANEAPKRTLVKMKSKEERRKKAWEKMTGKPEWRKAHASHNGMYEWTENPPDLYEDLRKAEKISA
jgi:hypothetical protein